MELQELATEHEDAFLRMTREYPDHPLYGRSWTSLSFRAYLKDCEKQRQDWRPKGGDPSVTRYVLVDGGEICGNGEMRFPLDEEIEASGGNLVFDVPPAKRRQGYGPLVLNRMLFEAVRAGLARVLVTCPAEQAEARKCIELNRGELEGIVGGRARYWIRLR